MAFMFCPKCNNQFDPTVTPPKREIGRTKVHRLFCPMCGVPSPAIDFMKPQSVQGAGVPFDTQKMSGELGPNGKPLTPSQRWVKERGINMFGRGGSGIPVANVPNYDLGGLMRAAAKIAEMMDEEGEFDYADVVDSMMLSEP